VHYGVKILPLLALFLVVLFVWSDAALAASALDKAVRLPGAYDQILQSIDDLFLQTQRLSAQFPSLAAFDRVGRRIQMSSPHRWGGSLSGNVVKMTTFSGRPRPSSPVS